MPGILPDWEDPRKKRSRQYQENIAKIAKDADRRTREADAAAWQQRRQNFSNTYDNVTGTARATTADLISGGVTAGIGLWKLGQLLSDKTNTTQQSQQPQPTPTAPGATRPAAPTAPATTATTAQPTGTTTVPWGLLSVIAGALFFFAPITPIIGISLGIVGLYSLPPAQATQRRLSGIGLIISGIVLTGFILLILLNGLLNLLGHTLASGM